MINVSIAAMQMHLVAHPSCNYPYRYEESDWSINYVSILLLNNNAHEHLQQISY